METRSITTEVPMAPRMPQNPAELIPELAELSAALFKVTGNGSVPRSTISLVHLRAGQIVGSTYLTVLHTGFLRKAGESEERITSVASWQDSPYFTGAERAALALVEAVLQPSADGERVSNELYAQAAEHYEPKALATLMVAIGQVNFFTPVALIARPVPGRSFTDPWQ
ncbi:carboxymuconolactone decarboxylase family protein [Streptomyces sp. NPDC048751]|uniref:carboxymuconolactone decarboxylase family protein n=1 Tax=Streptomyces sp. NPDC048751 TaxID=3365591 RepID=UPI003715CB34